MLSRSGYWPNAIAEELLDRLGTKLDALLTRLPAGLAAARLAVDVSPPPPPAPPTGYISREVLALPESRTLRVPANLRGLCLTAERGALVQIDGGDLMLLTPGERLSLPDQTASRVTYRAPDVFRVGRLSLLGRV